MLINVVASFVGAVVGVCFVTVFRVAYMNREEIEFAVGVPWFVYASMVVLMCGSVAGAVVAAGRCTVGVWNREVNHDHF
jgi:hypothetical protein